MLDGLNHEDTRAGTVGRRSVKTNGRGNLASFGKRGHRDEIDTTIDRLGLWLLCYHLRKTLRSLAR